MDAVKVKGGKKSAVQFPRIASLVFEHVTEEGMCSLSIKGALPALVEGFKPGWPVCTYRFQFTGKLSKVSYTYISFDVDDMFFGKDLFSLRPFPLIILPIGVRNSLSQLTVSIHHSAPLRKNKFN